MRRRLLIIDDDPQMRQILALHFSARDYEVRMVGGGDEALALAPAYRPEIVLLDLLMPGMSGIDTLKALKRLSPAPRVIMLSSADLDEVVQGALDLGADAYVVKPPDLAQLERLVSGFWPAPPSRHA